LAGLIDKLKKDKNVKEFLYEENKEVDFINTGSVVLNLLFSGRLDGGIPMGRVNMHASDSAEGKSFVSLKLIKNAQKKGLDCILVDTEFAFDHVFAKNAGVNVDNLIVYQNNQIEDVQEFIMGIFKDLEKKEKKNIFLIIDSWNAMVTSKTVGDATSGKDVSDMTISKKKNTLARLLNGLYCTVHVINQVYDNIMDMYNPISIPGGKGLYFSSSSIVLGTSKAKSKDGDEVNGVIITARTKKSRFCQENTKLKYLIKYDGGIHSTYGIDDDLFEFGYVTKPAMGWYQRDFAKLGLPGEDKKWRAKEMLENWKEFYGPIINNSDVKKSFTDKYTYTDRGIMDMDDMDKLDGLDDVLVDDISQSTQEGE